MPLGTVCVGLQGFLPTPFENLVHTIYRFKRKKEAYTPGLYTGLYVPHQSSGTVVHRRKCFPWNLTGGKEGTGGVWGPGRKVGGIIGSTDVDHYVGTDTKHPLGLFLCLTMSVSAVTIVIVDA